MWFVQSIFKISETHVYYFLERINNVSFIFKATKIVLSIDFGLNEYSSKKMAKRREEEKKFGETSLKRMLGKELNVKWYRKPLNDVCTCVCALTSCAILTEHQTHNVLQTFKVEHIERTFGFNIKMNENRKHIEQIEGKKMKEICGKSVHFILSFYTI